MIERVSAGVVCVQLQIVDVHGDLRARNQYLQLLIVEHLQPIERYHATDALLERETLSANLLVQLVIGHQVDVLDAIVIRHRDIGAARLQFVHSSLAQLVAEDGEVQIQIRHVTHVALQVEQIAIHDGIERGEVVHVHVGLPADDLG